MSSILVLPKPNTREFAHVKSIVNFDSIEAPVYPLILRRQQESYAHVSAIFVMQKSHAKYEAVKNLVKHWVGDTPKGKKAVIDFTGDYDINELSKKGWYVMDLRKKADTWENQIVLKNMDKASPHTISRICFELYEGCKSVVVFADSTFDVPCTLFTPAAWGLTEERNNTLGSFIYAASAKAITSTSSLALTAQSSNKDVLFGFNKFEEMPIFCSY